MNNKPVTSLYRRDEAIGRGNFGVVYKGVNLETKRVVAIKVLNLDTAEDEVLDVQHEITMLARLSQSDAANITKYYASYLHGTRLWIIMDLCAGGSVRTLLKAGRIEEKYTAVIVRELLQALAYIHKEGVIHRDIKAANVLITKEGKVRLCDFGVAAQVTATKLKRSTIVGTPYWMAPEVITKGALYNSKADIWSLGITIFEIATGNPPYSDQEAFRAIVLIPRHKPARLEGPMYSSALKEFVALCLDEHPQARPSAEELTKLKFVKSSKSTPTAILRDLVSRYMTWKERNTNVRDSIAILNTKVIPENGEDDFDDMDDGLNPGGMDTEDTVWDFDIDPSNATSDMYSIDTYMDFPSSLQQVANGLNYNYNHDTGFSHPIPPHHHTISNTPSPTSLDYSTTVGLGLSDTLNTSPPYPVSQLQSREATVRGGLSNQMGSVIPPVLPLVDGPQSLMGLFEDASISSQALPLEPPPLIEPVGLFVPSTSSVMASQATTPTVEIEIPTFEAITASATALASSGFSSNSGTTTVKTAEPIPPQLHPLQQQQQLMPNSHPQLSAATLNRNVPPPLPIVPPPLSESIEHNIQVTHSTSSSSAASSNISLVSPPALFHNHPHPLSNSSSPVSAPSVGLSRGGNGQAPPVPSLAPLATPSPIHSLSLVNLPSSSHMSTTSQIPNHRRTPSPKRMAVKLPSTQMTAVPPSPPREKDPNLLSQPQPSIPQFSLPNSSSARKPSLPTVPSISVNTSRPKLKAINSVDANVSVNENSSQAPTLMSPIATTNTLPPMVPVSNGSPLQHQQISPRPTLPTNTQSTPNLLRQPSQSVRGRERDNLRIAMPPPPAQFTSFQQQSVQQQAHPLQPPPIAAAVSSTSISLVSQSPPMGFVHTATALSTNSTNSSHSSNFASHEDTLEDIIPPDHPDQFPVIPKLDVAVLLDSTPKSDLISQLDDILHSLTNGLECLSLSLKEQ